GGRLTVAPPLRHAAAALRGGLSVGGQRYPQVAHFDADGAFAGAVVGGVAAEQLELDGVPGGEPVTVAVQLKCDEALLMVGQSIHAAVDQALLSAGHHVPQAGSEPAGGVVGAGGWGRLRADGRAGGAGEPKSSRCGCRAAQERAVYGPPPGSAVGHVSVKALTL